MAEKFNATCSICGKGYYKCLSCQSVMKAAPWKQYTDTSEHYKIFQIIKGYNTGVYTKEEANERLMSVDLSDLNELRENIRIKILDIMSSSNVASDTSVEDEVLYHVDDIPVVEVQFTETQEEDRHDRQRPYMNRKNKYSR